jgi:hypothetical protein
VVPPPPGTDGFANPGAFSPDGRTLAAVTSVGFSTRPALAMVAVDRAAAVRVPGSDGALADGCTPCLARAATVQVDVPFSFPPSFATTRPE